MVGIIATAIIAYWFFMTAERLKLPIFQWVIGGVVVYYAGFAACMYLLLYPTMGSSPASHSPWVAFIMDVLAAVAGVVLAALFRSKVMIPQGNSTLRDGE